ncbi:hypothetical protein Tsubulata_032041 [Turnera subulata]|uniref:Drought induced 19 protein type zinc-binding domain-containing protein n=1 Tax=Turnera subulata TaxID=218843 RepID=A0A9Q0FYQ2_9ROSI|nr:hypothetical protein Tsubulata_032041 [Turnera subulata]
MEDDTWSYAFSTSPSSRGYQSPLKSISDLCPEYEEIDEEDDLWAEYPCPFCDEEFDLVELCSHISEDHDLDDDDPAVCPVCDTRVGIDMSTSYLKKELEDEYFRPPYSGSSTLVSSSKVVRDPLLSFLFNIPSAGMSDTVQSDCSTEETVEEKSPVEKISERDPQPSPLSDEEHKEKAKKSEFVQGLLLSIMLDDIL